LGDLVHNPVILDRLRRNGLQSAPVPEALSTPAVLITAHGTSNRTLNDLRRRGFEVHEATCPLVRHAHQAVLSLARSGFHPVIVGQRDHAEVRGLTGDLDAFDVVLAESDVDEIEARSRFGVIAQTTQPVARVQALAARLADRFPSSEVRVVDTVCRPTKDRQEAAETLARECDVVVVIGGARSNNTRELVTTCRRYCARVHHVEGSAGLKREWFGKDDTVGVTAGTSTPDETIAAVEQQLRGWAAEAMGRCRGDWAAGTGEGGRRLAVGGYRGSLRACLHQETFST
jgi:4-hydroxy-3-methylbut-2-enyl diphosphate reductase